MARLITSKQKKWADKKLEIDNGTQAALAVYDTTDPNTAANIASENLRKPNVIEYLEGKASLASSRIVQLAQQNKHLPTALNAAKDILDRAGFSAIDKSLSVTANVSADQLKEILNNDLNKFRNNKEAP